MTILLHGGFPDALQVGGVTAIIYEVLRCGCVGVAHRRFASHFVANGQPSLLICKKTENLLKQKSIFIWE